MSRGKSEAALDETYYLGILIFIKDIQGGAQGSTQDSRILYISERFQFEYSIVEVSRTRYDRQLAPEVSQSDFRYIDAVDHNSALGCLDEAEEGQCQSTLS